MGTIKRNFVIQQEIRRLSFLIAVARYELEEAVYLGTPLGLCQELCQTIAVCQLQRSALRDGRFKELPYNIKLLYVV